MPFTKTTEILKDASDKKYAVGAFNLCGLDQSPALIREAEKIGSSILITIPAVIEPYVDFGDLGVVTKFAAELSSIPVGLHLSHGMDIETVQRAIASGFTSVMFDGSKLPLEENIKQTKIAVDIGHTNGVAVEGELGALGTSSDLMTDPELAERYVRETGVDILAIAIGNAHGYYKGTPKLDFQRLEAIKKAISFRDDVYLTLHGGTGIPEADMKKAVAGGITKICIYTEMCGMGKDRALEYLARTPDYSGNYDVPELIKRITGGFVDIAREFMIMFGSASKFESGSSTVFPDSKPNLRPEDLKKIVTNVVNALAKEQDS